MRAFVAGATGYTGQHVVRELRGHGVAAVAHVRPDSPRLAEWDARFQAHYAVVEHTPWELHAMRELLERWQPTHVFSLLGTTRTRARREGTQVDYEAVDYGLTSLLLKAVLLTGRTTRFIYLSAIGAGIKTSNPYLHARHRIEQELRDSGLPYVIARPAFVTGSDREEFRLAERVIATVTDGMLELGGLIGLRKLRNRFHSLSGRQLACALVRAALDERYMNATLEVADLHALAKS